ncbi:hypothetical protein K1T71_011543 [Dendrolimus kikuchii]|uniref:Uncharacterized protein n=1 Tax=Dendrolimus kikuchii TaxID=765133 RepID=A0ACC1CPH8_9NEOP|nr:hypothetical protein K1T71_011543 [Dendrolimus kikuchii]
MAVITRILLVTCLVLAVQGATLHLEEDVKITPNGKNFTVSSKDATTIIESKVIPKEKDAKVSSKDATSIIKNALNKNGAHFGSIEKFKVSKSPEKELGKAISESIKTIHGLVEGGMSKHAAQISSHGRGNGFKTLSSIKNPLMSKDNFLDMKKNKEIKFVINNKKTTNFEVSTIKNEIFGRGNIRLQGNGKESFPSSESENEKLGRKESMSTFYSGKSGVPVINMNVHNLNAPNEGLIYVNNPLASVKPERDQNYVLVNVSGQPALIPSGLLGKPGYVPKEKEINNTKIATGFPIFDFWPAHPIQIPKDKIVSENDTILQNLRCSQIYPELSKESLNNLEAFLKTGLSIPKLPNGCFDWEKINNYVSKQQPTITKFDFTTPVPEEHSKLGLPVPKQPDGSIDWRKVISHLSYIGTGNPVKLPIKPTLSPQEQEISSLYSKLGLQLPRKPDGDIDWDDAYRYLLTLQKQIKKTTGREDPEVEKEKMLILQQLVRLGISIPKLPNGQIDWQRIAVTLKNAGTTETPPTEIPTNGVIVLGKTNLLTTHQKLGLPIPTKADGSKDWDAIIKHLMEHGYKIESGKISGEDNLINMDLGGRLELLHRLQSLGLPTPTLANGKIDWQSIYQDLNSNGYNIGGSHSSLGFNINKLGLLDRLKLLEKLQTSGVTIPKLANGNLDWVAISKYFANNDGSLNLNLINPLSVQDRLKLLNQLKGLGVPLYTLPNGRYDWARILRAVSDRGIKLTGTVGSVSGRTYDIGSTLTPSNRMESLREVTRRNLPESRLPAGGIDWNAMVNGA